MMLDVSGMLAANENLKYIHTLLHGEALRKFDNFCYQVGCTTMAHLNQVALSLDNYFSHGNTLSKQNCVMCPGMRKPREFK